MTDKPDETAPKAGYIPKPPGKAELDQVSRDQALITDEWADAEPPAPTDTATDAAAQRRSDAADRGKDDERG